MAQVGGVISMLGHRLHGWARRLTRKREARPRLAECSSISTESSSSASSRRCASTSFSRAFAAMMPRRSCSHRRSRQALPARVSATVKRKASAEGTPVKATDSGLSTRTGMTGAKRHTRLGAVGLRAQLGALRAKLSIRPYGVALGEFKLTWAR